MNKSIKRRCLFYFLGFFMALSLTGCYELESFSEEDSGFTISIFNYTDKEYVGCKFYMGAFDENNHYIAVDSLIYPNLVIHKNTEGTDIDTESGYSRTNPFKEHQDGLNKFGYWEPKLVKVEEISGESKVHFKAVFSDQTIFNSSSSPNGDIAFKIKED